MLRRAFLKSAPVLQCNTTFFPRLGSHQRIAVCTMYFLSIGAPVMETARLYNLEPDSYFVGMEIYTPAVDYTNSTVQVIW